ncbi:hypothetical protein [Micromonospora sp. NPDC047730]|uniref:hypothetical protein n=1 Tax=Micromonospora sp. NPDC047730 TaxID=3364253 RepID=UPI00371BB176
MTTTASTTFALPSPDAGMEREARNVRKGWWVQLDRQDPTSWALIDKVEFQAMKGGVSDRYRKPVLVTTGGQRICLTASEKLRTLNVREVKAARLDGLDPANPFEPAPAHTRPLVSFARALAAGAVTEDPRPHSSATETRRRPIGGARNVTRMSFVRCGELAKIFERSGLAVRPTWGLPKPWTLTEAGERWLAEGLTVESDELPQRVAA